MKSLNAVSAKFDSLTNGQGRPQLAALNFDSTGDLHALDHYFPIVHMFDEADSFYQLVQNIAQHPNFDLQLIGANKTNLSMHIPASVRHLVAGHLAEVFYFRHDILARFLSSPRRCQE